jgi:hypothetical protein
LCLTSLFTKEITGIPTLYASFKASKLFEWL